MNGNFDNKLILKEHQASRTSNYGLTKGKIPQKATVFENANVQGNSNTNNCAKRLKIDVKQHGMKGLQYFTRHDKTLRNLQ